MKPALLLLSLFSAIGVYSQVGSNTAGSRSQGLGNASLTLSDAFSAGNNPAGMAGLEAASIGVSSMSFYGFSDLTNTWLAAAIPTNSGTFGTSLQYLGDATFNQAKLGLAYGRRLGEQVQIGVQIDYCQTRVNEIGTGNAFTFDAGLQFEPIDGLTTAARVFNPVRASAGEGFAEERLPTLFAIGAAYEPSEGMLLLAEAEQSLDNELNLKMGIEVPLVEELVLRGGYMSMPSMFTFGAGVRLKALHIDLAAQFHQQLGISPSLGINYTFQ
ncbi:MAG: hypothetical protein ABR95_00760 [Sphingobacteriales bacterium BACL12 MAG-120813-bin55]|nr:MAG: hypothetical protein ABR94_01755 [Sphingobacteriales bacterium BACL12 MAG-120802-bin5]KRP13234.1 MAG: hypothetical protein ABR95_00760 [Sphingobacteriales bacterium BACL12 MAG-120813-bin55]